MNISRSKQSIITKVVKDSHGVECFVRFLIIETEAGIDVKVLSAVPIVKSDSVYQISGCIDKCIPTDVVTYKEFNELIIDNNLEFFLSQPTRAPSF